MSFEFEFSAPAKQEDTRDVYTPSRLNREARTMLERGFAALWVEGEISNLSRPSSGHWYFSLKDDAAQLRCAMFRQKAVMTRFTPKDGMHVQIRGRVSLYEARGEYQFIVDHMEEAGEGALRRQFELLKAKLAAEGLFATERKRPLPTLPRRIGVITSPTGAAIRDVLHILKRRFCSIPVLIYPVPVQGDGVAPRIASAIRFASAHGKCDVLVLARGGGSLEDLWAFNEEVVARAIFESQLPIVTGIGHEVDFTIADFVADVRAPTPSGAAELIAPDCNEWLRSFDQAARRMRGALRRQVDRRSERATWLARRLAQLHPGIELRQRAQRLDELEQRLTRGLRHLFLRQRSKLAHEIARLRHASPRLRLAKTNARLQQAGESQLLSLMRKRIDALRSQLSIASGRLNTVSPLATLQRGYAIVTNAAGTVVTDASALKEGDRIEAKLAKGSVHARVEGTSKE